LIAPRPSGIRYRRQFRMHWERDGTPRVQAIQRLLAAYASPEVRRATRAPKRSRLRDPWIRLCRR